MAKYKIIIYEVEGSPHTFILYGVTKEVDAYRETIKQELKKEEFYMYHTIKELGDGVFHCIDSCITVIVLNIGALLHYAGDKVLPAPLPKFTIIRGGLKK